MYNSKRRLGLFWHANSRFCTKLCYVKIKHYMRYHMIAPVWVFPPFVPIRNIWKLQYFMNAFSTLAYSRFAGRNIYFAKNTWQSPQWRDTEISVWHCKTSRASWNIHWFVIPTISVICIPCAFGMRTSSGIPLNLLLMFCILQSYSYLWTVGARNSSLISCQQYLQCRSFSCGHKTYIFYHHTPCLIWSQMK